jgi:hypothetical protein
MKNWKTLLVVGLVALVAIAGWITAAQAYAGIPETHQVTNMLVDVNADGNPDMFILQGEYIVPTPFASEPQPTP